MNVTLDLIFIASHRKEWPMTFIAVRCPHCQSDQIVKRGKTARGTQRYLCQNTRCAKSSFLHDSCNRGCLPEVNHTIIDMSLNASGVRDTARSLHISPTTVLSELKKKEAVLESVNTALLRTLNPEKVTVDIDRAGEAEMDEMWSFVGHKLLGGLHSASGSRRALPGQTEHPEDRAQAPDIADTHQTPSPQDDLLLENHADA